MVVDFRVLRRIAGTNFRDLGGHPTADGRRVRRKMVYRSSHLAKVPPESPLRQIRLRTLVTLQSRVEVSHLGGPEPTLLGSARWKHIPMGDQWFKNNGEFSIGGNPGREHVALVTDFAPQWRSFFEMLAEREVYPLLFHCSAGRDRTGVGAAMLLELLGVDRQRIMADFLESNSIFPKTPLGSEQLSAVFELIDDNGGIESFMQKVLGVSAADLSAISNILLEP